MEPCWNLPSLLEFCWNLSGKLLEPSWNLTCNLPWILFASFKEPCWNMLESSYESCCNFPIMILLDFNFRGGEWYQQNSYSGKPESYWNLIRMWLEYCRGRLLEPAGNWSNLAGILLDNRWNLAGALLELSWNLAGKLLGHCWNFIGTWYFLIGRWWNLAVLLDI